MIELMVVVAIIGGLSAIGIPLYSKFHAKARQSEAKLALAALFTAEETFNQEWNQFSVTLAHIGFAVQGARLRYKTGFPGVACAGYSTSDGAPPQVADISNSWSDGASANTSSAIWSVTITEPAASGATCAAAAFVAASYGNPATTVTDPGPLIGDLWTIDQDKNMLNVQRYLGD